MPSDDTPPFSRRLLLVTAYLGFISLGLPDTLIGVAWPSVRDFFGRQQSEIAWIFFGAGASYFVSGLLTGKLLKSLGIGALLAGSSLLVAASALGYAVAPAWALFATCALLHGLGSGAIDAGLNHYVANHFSPRHMNWLHACYGIGATLGPLIMTSMLVSLGEWRAGYATVGALLLLLTGLFFYTRKLWDTPGETTNATSEPEASVSMLDALKHGGVWGHVVLFFIYTGLEVTVGQWSFTVMNEARSMSKETAGMWVTIYWASIAIGRVGFGFVIERLGIDLLLRLSMLGAVLGTALFAANTPFSAGALALVGLGLASIYPCLMTRTPQRLGKARAAHAIGFQVSAAMVGAALLPSFCGWLAQSRDLEAVTLATVAMASGLLVIHESLLRFDRRG
ncbi:MFS transporter [Prosthecobacter fluviatilis]|uniref:MFS transporter n=1 Tax=Prosthecobacter fluviatilis TaxID=445931 RepID=A0ABW0KM78_9BACT